MKHYFNFLAIMVAATLGAAELDFQSQHLAVGFSRSAPEVDPIFKPLTAENKV